MNETSNHSRYLLERWEQGDQDAATAIFDRYVSRLVRLVNARLGDNMRARFDPDDVVQSAFREFYDKAARHAFILQRNGSLWSILAAIAMNKLKRQIEVHTAKKRSPQHERPAAADDIRGVPLIDNAPTPEDAAIVLDELRTVMSTLRPSHREMLAQRLQGASVERIARQVQRAEATVQQVLIGAERKLRERLNAPA